MALINLNFQLKKMQNNPSPFYSVTQIDESDMYNFTGCITAPDDTPYQGGKFFLHIRIPFNYPYALPIFTFITKIFHPNINPDTGEISISILQDDYSPVHLIRIILLSLVSFLDDPHPQQALMPEIAHVYLTDRELFNQIAKEWTYKYAM